MIAHNNLVIAESGNIITYLLSTFGASSPFSASSLSQERQIRNTYYLHYAEGSLMVGRLRPLRLLVPERNADLAVCVCVCMCVCDPNQPILVNKLAFSKFPDMSPWYARPIIAGFAAQVSKNWMDKELQKHLGMVSPRAPLLSSR